MTNVLKTIVREGATGIHSNFKTIAIWKSQQNDFNIAYDDINIAYYIKIYIFSYESTTIITLQQ